MESKKFEAKIKLYCTLYGNNANSIQCEPVVEANCAKCRAKNEGICDVVTRGNNRQILYNRRTGKIEMMSQGGYLAKDTNGLIRKINDNHLWRVYETCWVCFGFLRK